MTHSSHEIEKTILALCLERGAGKTICPSEVARTLEQQEEAWRSLMPDIRAAAQEMAQSGQISIYRKGAAQPDHDVTGLVRLGLPREA